MESFEYNANPGRVVFGRGSLKKLPSEISRLNVSSPLVLSTPQQIQQAEALEKDLDGRFAGIFSEAAMHTPTHITDKAVQFAQSQKADSIVSVGGGSTIGLGKAISIRTGLPHISIPTTYAGSEMTPILGETADGQKKTRNAPKILPETVIYDVDLTMTLPVGLSATSGVNAIAHAVEALYAKNTNPIVSLLALEGGSFNLPHAETHTIILPHALAYNAPSIPQVMEKLAGCFPESNGDAIQGLNVLLAKLKVKRALKDFGMKSEDIDRAAELAVSNPYYNPRPLEKESIRELIRRAWAGEEARSDF
ncbi:MAG: hypothetical protein M1819_002681 [Sarea resinae]|nr:MAG: hypothetical protein M1819_002681 [Sarea resinae]